MKKIKYLILTAIAVVVFSCEDTFLSPDLTTGVDASSYYSSDEEIETGIINIYDGIQGVNAKVYTSSSLNHSIQVEFYVTEMRSGNTRTKSQEGEAAQFETLAVESTNGIVSDYYRSFYNIIFRANTVLDNLGSASEGNAVGYEAESKFLRAYAYFNLVRLYGDIPLITSVILPSDQETAYTRVATSTIYDLIISDLETAIAGLDNTYKDRASKAAAQALLAKVYLSSATPNYSEAQVLCEAVMGSGFSLLPNYEDVFFEERNDEIIFAIGFESGTSNDSQNFSAEFLNSVGRTSGVNYVTDDFVAVLDVSATAGDTRIEHTYRVDPFQTTQNQNIKYLPDGQNGGDNGRTFDSDAQLAGNDWIVLRYADVVLMHVEAIMAGAEETASATAVASFNLIRDRAGLGDDADDIITKQELLDERHIELAFENQRIFDLIRLGEAGTVLSEYAINNGYSYSSTDLLLPIPQYEINLSNGLLTQNPGY